MRNTWPPSKRLRGNSSALSKLKPMDSRAPIMLMSPLARPSIARDRAELVKNAPIASICSNSSSNRRRLPSNNQLNAEAKHREMRTEPPANANSNNKHRTPDKSNNRRVSSRHQVVLTMRPSKKRCKLSSNRYEVMLNDH